MTSSLEALDEAIRSLESRGHAGPKLLWRANDVLAALDAAGWAIVPKVLTPEMIEAASPYKPGYGGEALAKEVLMRYLAYSRAQD